MKIVRVGAYRVDLPRERTYRLSGGRTSSSFDTTVVRVESDAGLVGLGEVCPFGAAYLPAYAAGARTGIAEVAPHLIGEDPRQVERVNQTMDMALKGHPYVKSALDMACWDLLGQAAGMALSTLLGGRFGDDVELYQTIPHGTPDAMRAGLVEARAEGYRRFQPKVGASPIPISSVSSPWRRNAGTAKWWWSTPTAAGWPTRRCGWSAPLATSTSPSNSPAPPMKPAWRCAG
jgi:L-alanine-DL-glutamate epimerase-like enolase superfamily enzyme